MTLLGFFFILASFGVTVWDAPTLVEPLPSWVYLFNALCVFLYQTFDALDGKQARRTGALARPARPAAHSSRTLIRHVVAAGRAV